MLIKIKYKGKTEMHDAQSYFRNELEYQAFDLNIKTITGELVQYHFNDSKDIECYVMNEQGKTVDRV